ncbi:DUF397 domain-containing protein [Spongiactinospora sp. TRM90649]|uniref:DUF397 domain-containing protein n=1 Tax=Spongiactinospora sp. TRM90649 TaxID=3031114 RepID=UPI0023F7A32F|nr:DUF397 domain-containing protein [Spongiactinospora sp. TRM90649]MDF5752491.1 DUF397 domain-containing protein [Spongiactinospora sp. TRM90649]
MKAWRSAPLWTNTTVWTRACNNGGCVEVASHGDVVAVRDSENGDGPVLTVTRADWENFLAAAKAGLFDRI